MITRNNYEEFFLLYVDNELSPADRQAVERFVDEHPDLKEEWDLLLQCRMVPAEEVSFPGIALLLRSGTQESENPPLIDAGNYETWFLSFVDGELDEPARQAVADFLRQHPEKNIELRRLQQTVTAPDLSVVFPDKESLYHKEDKRKIAWLPFARIAAAALILGAIGLLIFHPFRKDNTVVKNTSLPGKAPVSPAVTSPALTSPEVRNEKPAPILVDAPGEPAIKKQGGAVTPRPADPLYLSDGGKQKTSPSRTVGETKEDALLAKVNPARHLAVLDPQPADRAIKVPVTMAVNTDRTQNGGTGIANASFASQALLSQTTSDEDAQEETASPRKNKLRGIFRRVTRVLEKPAASEDDDNKKVIIGGIQFALK